MRVAWHVPDSAKLLGSGVAWGPDQSFPEAPEPMEPTNDTEAAW